MENIALLFARKNNAGLIYLNTHLSFIG